MPVDPKPTASVCGTWKSSSAGPILDRIAGEFAQDRRITIWGTNAFRNAKNNELGCGAGAGHYVPNVCPASCEHPHDDLAEAVAGAGWIQESVPERLDLKHKTFAAVQAACDATAIIGSSTSGFKPSELQQGAARPGQIVVTHPFNPVYLLPLIELVPSALNDADLIHRAKDLLTGLGFFPLHVKKEIDAHIADRFLEAVWREALWLVKDGVATTEEIDEAIRMHKYPGNQN